MKNKVRTENRRALPKFLLIILGSAVVGGVLGFGAGFARRVDLKSVAGPAVMEFLRVITPWAIPVCTVVLLGIALGYYRSARKIAAAWDGDEESAPEEADRRLSWALLLTSLTLVLDFFFLAASTADFFGKRDLMPLYVVAAFMVSCGLIIFFQQKVVDLTKRMNPEKRGSVYDMKFQNKWFQSCDEAEKKQIGQAAYRAYRITGNVCILLWLLLLISNMVFDFGLMPIFVVLVLWGVLQVTYTLECIRMSKRKEN